MEPIRVLQVVPNMQAGGLESFIMNIYRHIDRSQVQFDFLVHYRRRCFFDDEIERLGGRIYRLSVREDNNVFKYIRDLKCFFREHSEYRIVHGHMASLASFYLGQAKKGGVPTRILHSHNERTESTAKGRCKWFLSRFSKSYANIHFACSEKAGLYLFGTDDFTVIHNAVDISRFHFEKEVRNQTRQELGLSDQLVLGHIGRFNAQKNHSFLLDVFEQVHKKNRSAVLLLAGDGALKKQMEDKAKELGIQSSVMFLGVRRDAERLYQAMDVFVLPSLFEGLPVVGVEAQAAGVPCFFADTVTPEAKLTDLVTFLPLNSPADSWADCILKQSVQEEREDVSSDLLREGYDIREVAKELERFYLEEYRENGDL